MKTHPSRRQNGFTLVELLVVISIIAVLAAAGFAAGGAAIAKAKKTAALSTMLGLESAVNNFASEYGTMPVKGMTSDEEKKSDDTDLLEVLLGTEADGNEMLNPRKIKFLSVKEGKAKGTKGINGILYNKGGTKVIGLFDPWGGVYHLKFDGDYDDQIKSVKTDKDTNQPVTLNGKKVAVWTNGADGENGNGGTAADDVRSWAN